MTSLTPEEFRVVALLAQGKSNQTIADELHKSRSTVRCQIHNAMNKTRTVNRTQLANWYYEREGK